MGVDNLKPCPFCGSRVLSLEDNLDDLGLDVVHVNCQRCAATGPFHGDEEVAKALWNERAQLVADALEGEKS